MTEPSWQPAALPVAGWYEDPESPRFLRYWDGARWTEHTRFTVAKAGPAAPRHRLGTAAVLGIITSVMLLGLALVAIAALAEREEVADHAEPSPSIVASLPSE